MHYNLPINVEGISRQDVQRVVVGVKALLRANVSLVVEGRFHTKAQGSADRNDGDQIIFALETGL